MTRNLEGLALGRGWWKGKTFPESYRLRLREAHKGKKPSEETRKKMSEAHKGVVISQAHREAISAAHKGKVRNPWTPESREKARVATLRRVAEGRHNNYYQDRSLLKKKQERNDPAYFEWRKKVWLRDNFKCKIANEYCDGRIEAHHILGWSEYPELRYEINNGITLCHAHHPRKRAEEKRLQSEFQALVSVSEAPICQENHASTWGR